MFTSHIHVWKKEESKQVLHFARVCILAGYPLKQDNSGLRF